MRYIDK